MTNLSDVVQKTLEIAAVENACGGLDEAQKMKVERAVTHIRDMYKKTGDLREAYESYMNKGPQDMYNTARNAVWVLLSGY